MQVLVACRSARRVRFLRAFFTLLNALKNTQRLVKNGILFDVEFQRCALYLKGMFCVNRSFCKLVLLSFMATIEQTFARLAQSHFRARFHLKAKERAYVKEKGIEVIQRHAEDFIQARLAPAFPVNDGKQTPMRGHPVFIAQHACACCCRTCLEKWYHIPQGEALSAEIQGRIVRLLIAWIEKEMTQAT
jgi:hypothetical protein